MQPIDVSSEFNDLLPNAWVREDAAHQLTSADLLANWPADEAFGSSTASFGFRRAAHWFGVDLHNPKALPLERLLLLTPTWLDQVQVYLLSAEGKLVELRGGDTLPFSIRGIDHHNINFLLQIPPGNSRLMVRTETVDPYVVNLGLWDRAAFYRADANQRLYIGAVYGAIAALLLYNLVVFFSVRESIYAAYSGYLFFFLLMHATYNGYNYPLWWPDSPHWGNWAHSIFIYIFVFSGLYFSSQFLQLKEKMPRGLLVIKMTAALALLTFLLTAMFGGYGPQVQSAIVWVVLYAPLVVVLGIISLWQGNTAARYFLSAALAGFIGSFVTALTVLGFMPFLFFTYHAVDFGMLVDAVLLSLALADRLRIARAETEEAKNQLLETTARYAEELEHQVALRTAELQQANATKDKFLSIVGHDLKSPIGGLNVLFNSLVNSREDLTEDTLQTVRTTIRSTSEFLDQLFTWARSQRGEINCHPQRFDINLMMQEISALYANLADNKGVTLNLDLGASYFVYADREMIHAVLRNLVGNALKFSYASGMVYARAAEAGGNYHFEINDNGTGISPGVLTNLFRLDAKPSSTPGTQNESGTGLGLILCAEFVHKNGGQIGVESEDGSGTRFWFSLPRSR